MKLLLSFVIVCSCLLYFANALSETRPSPGTRAEFDRLRYIYKSRPVRRDEPLRAENISDREIREIQATTDAVFPGAIANVSGVTRGCPCEDGPDCDNQVWILAYRDSRYDGLLLSRIENKWVVGPVQAWWLDYDRIQFAIREIWVAKPDDYRSRYRELREKQLKLQETFPSCAVDVAAR